MILAEGVDDISCKQNFENILPADGCDIALIHDCWRALYRANSIGWTVLAQDIRQSDNDNSSFDLDEFTHYSKPANGSIYKVVPEKIICFPNPTKLPDGVHWMDFEGGSVRRFSAAFFADLFAELGVSAIVCLHDSDYERDAFLARGIEVEDLGVDPASPHMLRAIDRFLDVAAAAPGLVALHSGGPGPGHMGALVLSYLTSRAGFDGASAAAWVRMMHPALLEAPEAEGPGPGLDTGVCLARTASALPPPSLPPLRAHGAGPAGLFRRTLSEPPPA